MGRRHAGVEDQRSCDFRISSLLADPLWLRNASWTGRVHVAGPSCGRASSETLLWQNLGENVSDLSVGGDG